MEAYSGVLKYRTKQIKEPGLSRKLLGLMLKPLVIESYIVTKSAFGVRNGYPIIQI